MYKLHLMNLMKFLMNWDALNTYHIAIGPSVLSEVDVPHKTQLTLRDIIQTELHQMAESFGVYSDITDWVNSMVTVLK